MKIASNESNLKVNALFVTKQKGNQYFYLLLSTSLNICEIFLCRLWRQSFFECIWARFAVANISLISNDSFLVNPISLRFSRMQQNNMWKKKNRKFFERVFLFCFCFHLKILVEFCPKITTNLSLKVPFFICSRSNNSLAIAEKNNLKMTEITSHCKRLAEIRFNTGAIICTVFNAKFMHVCSYWILLTTVLLCLESQKMNQSGRVFTKKKCN